jgi:hypothetical protein
MTYLQYLFCDSSFLALHTVCDYIIHVAQGLEQTKHEVLYKNNRDVHMVISTTTETKRRLTAQLYIHQLHGQKQEIRIKNTTRITLAY